MCDKFIEFPAKRPSHKTILSKLPYRGRSGVTEVVGAIICLGTFKELLILTVLVVDLINTEHVLFDVMCM